MLDKVNSDQKFVVAIEDLRSMGESNHKYLGKQTKYRQGKTNDLDSFDSSRNFMGDWLQVRSFRSRNPFAARSRSHCLRSKDRKQSEDGLEALWPAYTRRR